MNEHLLHKWGITALQTAGLKSTGGLTSVHFPTSQTTLLLIMR